MGPIFERLNLKPEDLSRILEDSEAQSASLVPLTGSGIYTSGALVAAAGRNCPFVFWRLLHRWLPYSTDSGINNDFE